jgi:hypothetical protein
MSSQDENRSPDAVKLEVKLNDRKEHASPSHFNLGLNLMSNALFNDPEPEPQAVGDSK